MEIKFNKVISIVLISILILINLFEKTFVLLYIDFFRLDSNYKLSVIDILITGLASNYLSNLIIGIWLFTTTSKFKQDRLSWFLIGLAFEQYSLIFLMILIIVRSIKLKVDLTKKLKPILILLIIYIFLNPTLNLIETLYLTNSLSVSDYAIFSEYKAHVTYININYWVVALLNILIAIKLYKFIGQLQIKGKLLWAISTVFLGLVPVILFNELVVIKKDNNNDGITLFNIML